jgi:predicted small metal-binding protein
MAVSIRCADFGNACPAQFTAPDEDELLQHVELHTKTAHQPMEWTPELVEVAKTHVREA